MGDADIQHWLAHATGLEKDVVCRWHHLFGKHYVDIALLDSFASDEGLRILAAWRTRPRHDAHEAPVGNGPAAIDTGQPSGQISRQTGVQGQSPATSRASHGRQRISTADRRSGAHYFAQGATASAEHRSTTGATRASCNTQEEAVAKASDGITPSAGRPLEPTRSTPPAQAYPAQGVGSRFVPETALSRPHHQGILKSFNVEKGYGFITSSCIEGDIFVLRSELVEGQCEPGRPLQFELVYDDRGRPQAQAVTFDAETRFVGTLKSCGEAYGFIDCPDAYRIHGRDVYIARAHVPDEAHEPGVYISFTITLNAKGQPQAKDVTCEDDDDRSEVADESSNGVAGAVHPDTAQTKKVARW